MNSTSVAVLTPPGSAAIAVLSIRGPGAWRILSSHFRTARGGQLPETFPGGGVWFGRFGDTSTDEVILIARADDHFELHCHGGVRIIRWLIDLFRSNGAEERPWSDEADRKYANPSAAANLPFARTVRTASILLDQANGAYDRAVAVVERGGPQANALSERIRQYVPVGRHLVQPWTVAIAGPPNAGKSTLLNALAGFDRSIVSPIPGTTRDAVSVSVAFDGWPVDLVDTAGLRESTDLIEGEGIARARAAVLDSDLCVWLVDATGPLPGSFTDIVIELGRHPWNTLVVFNKCEVAEVPAQIMPNAPRISAATGTGLSELVARIVAMLVPFPPLPGEPVSFTSELCDRWS